LIKAACKRYQKTSKIKIYMHPTILHMCTYCATLLENTLGHIISNDFIDTTFYGWTLPSFSSAERTCVAIFLLRRPNEHATRKLLYTGQNPQTTNQERK